jgi:hypothetical protein
VASLFGRSQTERRKRYASGLGLGLILSDLRVSSIKKHRHYCTVPSNNEFAIVPRGRPAGFSACFGQRPARSHSAGSARYHQSPSGWRFTTRAWRRMIKPPKGFSATREFYANLLRCREACQGTSIARLANLDVPADPGGLLSSLPKPIPRLGRLGHGTLNTRPRAADALAATAAGSRA